MAESTFHELESRLVLPGLSRRLGAALSRSADPELAPREEAAVLVAFTDGMLLEWIRRSQRLDGNRLVMSAKALIAGGLRKTP